jgi:hypothetical protein
VRQKSALRCANDDRALRDQVASAEMLPRSRRYTGNGCALTGKRTSCRVLPVAYRCACDDRHMPRQRAGRVVYSDMRRSANDSRAGADQSAACHMLFADFDAFRCAGNNRACAC